jgi:hypothetical protein
MHFLSRTSSDYISSDLSNSVMVITQTLNVGIATTTPATKLHINGVITATGGTSTNWNSSFGWGNHEEAGILEYLVVQDIGQSFRLRPVRSF